MNTKISFTYRDAANYKIQNSCVLAGEINSNMIAMILDACEDGKRFIPEAVGLPHATFEDIGYSYHDDLDHPWFELGKYNFELTFDPPSVDLTLPRLVANFVVHKNHWEDDVDEDTVNTDLYDKLFEEQSKFKEYLKTQTTDVILDRAYEFCIREDIICLFDGGFELPVDQAAVLLMAPNAMDTLYGRWDDGESNHMQRMQESIEDYCKEQIEQWNR